MKKNIALALIGLVLAASALLPAQQALEGKLLFGIGHFGARYLYHTYLTIGLTTDAWAANAKSPQDAKELVQRSALYLNASIQYFDELKDFALGKEDRQYILEMKQACADLLQMTQSFLSYLSDRRDSDRQAFSRSRESAWARIAKLNNLT